MRSAARTNTEGASLTTPVSPANGGTGVANGSNNTITFNGNFTLGITLSANTSVTFPTSGTLISTSTAGLKLTAALDGTLRNVTDFANTASKLWLSTSQVIIGNGAYTTPMLGVLVQNQDTSFYTGRDSVMRGLEVYGDGTAIVGTSGSHSYTKASTHLGIVDNGDFSKTYHFVIYDGSTTNYYYFDRNNNAFTRNTGAAPSTPSNGSVYYVEAGATKVIGSGGTITTIAAA